ncbi:MAG: phosphate ABC transporter ATP-binding protein [Anaerolineaceae bacterium 4572_32.1]|nr:MAG: phosphate ABC transporter ATP-binding protein [Anaerolineaceae bacterium 4572_32.1]
MSNANKIKIDIQNVTFSYSDSREPVLKDVSLQIRANEITVIFGPGMGGKSTLLRLLNRLNDLLEGNDMRGQILLDGRDIYAPGVNVIDLRRKVGMVFATPIPLPDTIRGNVAYGPKLLGLRQNDQLDDIVEKSLRAAALWKEVKDRLDEPAAALSGGQKQRLCLARTLALEPEVILLDNPTSGLDPLSTAKVEETLKRMKETYSIILVPHSVQQAARMADRAAFLLDGELIEAGSVKQIFTRPQHPRTEAYVTGRFG